MPSINRRFRGVVKTLATALDDVPWALTGSTSFALQGVPLTPNDVDVQTTEDGAYEIERRFAAQVVEPVSFAESASIRSHFGALEQDGVRVEIMGDVRKRRDGGTWGSPIELAEHHEFVTVDGVRVPVLSLEYEADAYEKLGRTERAALLREHAD
ncbi:MULTISPECIES: nucleotidyltransferase domain-containing protein [Natrialbaceae]|uniref:nucleotidyltransferase domain-containing protein n=1 Tax=Natrialbaceae TaxID=1644061 RepID=UPI00207CA37B|nr:hypothetical protein [Natronococcus sp. CG52]